MASIAAGQAIVELRFHPSRRVPHGIDEDVMFAESPAHHVMIRAGFYLGKYPVSSVAVGGRDGPGTPSRFASCVEQPAADSISWEDAVSFCGILTDRCGRHIRLPSEAEWEYACRAGTAGEFFFGSAEPFNDDSEVSSAIRKDLAEYAWFDLNSGGSTQPVAGSGRTLGDFMTSSETSGSGVPMFGTATTSEPPRIVARGWQAVIGNHDAVCVAEPGT